MDDLHLLHTIEDRGRIRGGVALHPMSRLHKIFEDGPEDEHIHIVVVPSIAAQGEGVVLKEDPTDIVVRLNTGETIPACFRG